MATHKQALKRHRQSLRRRTRNQSSRNALRTRVKSLRLQVTQSDAKMAKAELGLTLQALAKAGGKGLIDKKKASRLISRLQKAFNRATQK